jgi:hypothetical protein
MYYNNSTYFVVKNFFMKNLLKMGSDKMLTYGSGPDFLEFISVPDNGSGISYWQKCLPYFAKVPVSGNK